MTYEEKKKERNMKIFLCSITGVSVVAALICVKKVGEYKHILRTVTSRIDDMTSVDIPQAVIDDAVINAANKQVSKAVTRCVDSVQDAISQETRRRVNEAVRDNYDRISQEVSRSIRREVVKISAEDLADDIREAAKDELIEKLEDRFDDIIDDVTDSYTKNLNNMGKVYEAMAKKVTGNT